MARELSEILASGEILLLNTEHCNIEGALRLGDASESTDDGSLIQVVSNGVCGLHPPIQTSAILGDTDATDIATGLTAADIVILDISAPGYGSGATSAMAIGTASVAIQFRFDNTVNNQSSSVTISLEQDTGGGYSSIATQVHSIPASSTQDIVFSYINTVVFNTTDDLKFTVASSRSGTVIGTVTPSILQITDSVP